MKRKTFLLTLMALTTFSSCSHAASKQGSAGNGLVKTAICPDEKVRQIMGDSIADVVFSPKVNAIVYKMAPAEKAGDDDRTIGGVKVAKEIGKVDKSYFPIMQFLLSDSTTFSGETIVPAQPFVARAAMEFKLKKESVTFLFSFGSGEVAAVRKGKEVWRHNISGIRNFILFFNKIHKDEDFEFYLKK